MSAESIHQVPEPAERPQFATAEEASAYWAARLAQKPVTTKDRERLISLLLD